MKHRSEKEWQEIIQEQKRSGLTQTDWCNKNGIVLKSFSRNLCEQRKKSGIIKTNKTNINKTAAAEKNTTEWVELNQCSFEQLPDDNEVRPSQIKEEIKRESKIHVLVGSFTVELFDGFDEKAMTSVCRGLMSLC